MKSAIRIFIIFCVCVCAAGAVYLIIPGGPGMRPVLAAVNNAISYISSLRADAAAQRQNTAQRLVLLPSLIQAARDNDIRAAHALLLRGASADAMRNATSNTPLFAAVKNSNADIVALLLARGANPYQVTEEGQMPIHAALHAEVLGEDETAPQNIEIIRLLLERGVSINQRDLDGQTPLMYACKAHKPQTAAWLLQNGADSTARDDIGRSALEIAKQSGSLDCVNLLQ